MIKRYLLTCLLLLGSFGVCALDLPVNNGISPDWDYQHVTTDTDLVEDLVKVPERRLLAAEGFSLFQLTTHKTDAYKGGSNTVVFVANSLEAVSEVGWRITDTI